MVTSAPFDDWWHNAYGLDVEILSPPHIVLALGMVGLTVGAMLVLLAHQNRASAAEASRFAWMYSYAAACVLSFLGIMVSEFAWRPLQHSSDLYRVAGLSFPFFLVAAGNASRLRWGATTIAGGYMAIRIVMLWVLPLFPAEPGLGPIYQDITHMIPMEFPLLLVVPAIVMDLARQRAREDQTWVLALTQGLGFFVALLVAQFLFAYFLQSDWSRNRVFGTDYLPYMVPQHSALARRTFLPLDDTEASMRWALGNAALMSVLSAAVGTLWARWFRRVRR
jgi:hypothetical protein